jgi:uncharacterized damage-inducible protein DinB
MTSKAHFQTQFDYHGTIFKRLLDCAEKLDAEKYHEHPGYGLGSIHDILFHVLYWQNWWRQGVAPNGKRKQFLNSKDFETLADLNAGIFHEQTAWNTILANLTDTDIEGEITISGTTFTLWRILQHLIIHGMQHHSEIAVLLTEAGQSPGGIDFIWFNG